MDEAAGSKTTECQDSLKQNTTIKFLLKAKDTVDASARLAEGSKICTNRRTSNLPPLLPLSSIPLCVPSAPNRLLLPKVVPGAHEDSSYLKKSVQYPLILPQKRVKIKQESERMVSSSTLLDVRPRDRDKLLPLKQHDSNGMNLYHATDTEMFIQPLQKSSFQLEENRSGPVMNIQPQRKTGIDHYIKPPPVIQVYKPLIMPVIKTGNQICDEGRNISLIKSTSPSTVVFKKPFQRVHDEEFSGVNANVLLKNFGVTLGLENSITRPKEATRITTVEMPSRRSRRNSTPAVDASSPTASVDKPVDVLQNKISKEMNSPNIFVNPQVGMTDSTSSSDLDKNSEKESISLDSPSADKENRKSLKRRKLKGTTPPSVRPKSQRLAERSALQKEHLDSNELEPVTASEAVDSLASVNIPSISPRKSAHKAINDIRDKKTKVRKERKAVISTRLKIKKSSDATGAAFASTESSLKDRRVSARVAGLTSGSEKEDLKSPLDQPSILVDNSQMKNTKRKTAENGIYPEIMDRSASSTTVIDNTVITIKALERDLLAFSKDFLQTITDKSNSLLERFEETKKILFKHPLNHSKKGMYSHARTRSILNSNTPKSSPSLKFLPPQSSKSELLLDNPIDTFIASGHGNNTKKSEKSDDKYKKFNLTKMLEKPVAVDSISVENDELQKDAFDITAFHQELEAHDALMQRQLEAQLLIDPKGPEDLATERRRAIWQVVTSNNPNYSSLSRPSDAFSVLLKTNRLPSQNQSPSLTYNQSMDRTNFLKNTASPIPISSAIPLSQISVSGSISSQQPSIPLVNEDYCSTCGGVGHFVCCDQCPKSFHWLCLNPPMYPEELQDTASWHCQLCASKLSTPLLENLTDASDKTEKFIDHLIEDNKNSDKLNNISTSKSTIITNTDKNSPGGVLGESIPEVSLVKRVFKHLCTAVSNSLPKVFSLPESIKRAFEGVSSDPISGQYISSRDYRPTSKGPRCEILDGFGNFLPFILQGTTNSSLSNGSGGVLDRSSLMSYFCHTCSFSAMRGPLLNCDFCPLAFHLDCLDPPLTCPPPINRKWMCPLHLDHFLLSPRLRRRRDIPLVFTHSPYVNHQGDIKISLESSQSNRQLLSKSPNLSKLKENSAVIQQDLCDDPTLSAKSNLSQNQDIVPDSNSCKPISSVSSPESSELYRGLLYKRPEFGSSVQPVTLPLPSTSRLARLVFEIPESSIRHGFIRKVSSLNGINENHNSKCTIDHVSDSNMASTGNNNTDNETLLFNENRLYPESDTSQIQDCTNANSLLLEEESLEEKTANKLLSCQRETGQIDFLDILATMADAPSSYS